MATLREERNGGTRGYGRGGCVGNNQGEVARAVGAAVVDHSAAIGFMTYALRLRNENKEFNIEDQVMYQRRNRSRGKVRKLQTIWMGPYTIMNVDEETGNCTLLLPRDAKTHSVFAPDKLKEYNNPITIRPSTKEELERLEDISTEETTEYDVEKILGL